MRPFSSVSSALLALFAVSMPASGQAKPAADVPSFDAARFGAMRYRMVGPARGGRVTAVAGVPQEPATFYFGSTGGGVWKTIDGGIGWKNITDGVFASASIGSIDVADSDPNIIYVGTGSAAIRSNVSIGKGIYKSSDAGRTWKQVGLTDAGQIGAMVVHPTNPDIAFAAVLGNPFTNSRTRGVYRTKNGGGSWEQVLFLNDSVGAADIEMQPGNPNVLYASMWFGMRHPWTILSGGAEDGIFKSMDGGDHWTRLAGGLPTGVVGKADITVSDAAPQRVYALVEARVGGGLYRSDDAGVKWTLVSGTSGLITRPFYYDHVHADPTNADVLYVGTESFYKSTDGGKTFRTMRTPHGDNHDMWINPTNGKVFIQSNDGGVNVTVNGGLSWSTQENQPTAEIYQVAVDNQYPYRLYGAQQDNSTVIVPSLPTSALGLDEPIQGWQRGPGCETGPIIPNRTNADTVYGGCKGQFSRMSMRVGQEQQYWVGAQSLYGNRNMDLKYRFQRVSPMEVSPHEPHTVYYGSQYIHRSRDEGVTWERISPDLTANDPKYRDVVSGGAITIDATGEEMYATVYAIRESPITPGLIWAGSNDGPIHVTRDGGKTWTNVTPKDLPPGGRVQNIEPSPLRAGAAYVAIYRYLLGDFQPYIYKTEDYGKSWTRLTSGTNGIPADYPTRVVREDPARAGLLYAGTEFGMFVSFDDGGHWRSLQLNMPVTPITDIKVHRNDLAISTQGRSFWILDNLTPLQQLSDKVVAATSHLFAPRPAVRYRYRAGFGGIEGDRGATDDAPQYIPAGAGIDFWLSSPSSSPVTLDILDPKGAVIKNFSSAESRAPVAGGRGGGGATALTATAGLNRFVWDMTYPGPYTESAGQGGRGGPLAPPGRYSVRLSANGTILTQPLVIAADPRVTKDGVTAAVLETQLAHNIRVRELVSDANHTAERLRSTRARATAMPAASVATLSSIEAEFFTPVVRYSRPGLQTHITYLYSMTIGADQRVSKDAVERYDELRKALDVVKSRLAAISGPQGIVPE
ncbi:MAG: hypothetical protein ABJE47_13025 [bacterium]